MITIKLTAIEMGPEPREQYIEIAEGVVNAMVRFLQPKEPLDFSVTVQFKTVAGLRALRLSSKFKYLPVNNRITAKGTSRPRRP